MVLSTDQGLIISRKTADAHVQDFVVNDEFLLCTLSASQSALLHCPRLEKLDFRFVVLRENSAITIDRTPVAPAIAKSPAPLLTRQLPRGDHCMNSGFCSSNWFAAAALRMPFNPLFTTCYLIFTKLFTNYPVIRRYKIRAADGVV